MTWLEVIVLAIVQGITEFLPISSSAHLILPSQLFGWQDQGLAFDVAVHVGTLTAVVLYFRHDIVVLLAAWLDHVGRRKASAEARLAWAVLIGTIPAGLAGVIFNDLIETHLRSVLVIAATTIGFGILLAVADRKRGQRELNDLTLRDAVIIGLSQALALIPGTSRSGITMTAALFLNLSREAAARFSFLLSIPLISAAGMLKTIELIEVGDAAPWAFIIVGTLLAAISAYLCIHLFLAFITRIGLMPFVIYRLLLGDFLLWFDLS